MTVDPVPIAYAALQRGTPVQSSDGQQFGIVAEVLVVDELDVFDGIVVETATGPRFVDADQVGSIFTTYVATTLSPDEAADLPVPEGAPPVSGVDANDDSGTSMADRFGRMFGRGKRKREQ